jgi:hypothetical protein
VHISSTLTPALCAIGLLFLQACSSGPFVEDWDRERISNIADTGQQITVNVCFDNSEHTKEQVYNLARKECGVRIEETENLIQFSKAQDTRFQTEAEGQGFEGSVERSKRIAAMISTLQLVYIENDKWECPLMTPNRISFQCRYDKNAYDSGVKRETTRPEEPEMELPPELPDDLKP